ncbi:S-layer homology domain-containing protein [Paenibacillaceae bacterium WGS1546]|uniref:S-layer homology domain-containing protein n=1 Tax=Cohnella sp. WGS1546 TaxID=3366810 RepID=UPI00372D3286
MIRNLRRMAVLLLTIGLIWPAAVSAEQAGASPTVWISLKGKPAKEREELLASSRPSMDGWETGKIVSRDPLAVVTEYAPNGKEVKAKVQVWTGLLHRDGNRLVTLWDEVWYGPDGSVVLNVTELEYGIRDYFAAASQKEFQGLDYAGRYPWVSVPTDREAEENKLPRVSDAGYISLYETPLPDDPKIISSAAVESLPHIPDRIRPPRAFEQVELAKLPPDIDKHWAKAYIVDLMGKGIVSGYTDGTVKPDRTLTRSEFITLLMKGLQISPEDGAKSGYSDVSANWARRTIAQAEREGIVPKAAANQQFRPDDPITRLEMANWISNALASLGMADAGAAVRFKDVSSLPEPNQSDIRKAVHHGILKGYTDGTFRPGHSLTRAEAFVVISRLIAL